MTDEVCLAVVLCGAHQVLDVEVANEAMQIIGVHAEQLGSLDIAALGLSDSVDDKALFQLINLVMVLGLS